MDSVENFKIESKQTEEWLNKEFSQIHTGRAAPALLDGVMVLSYEILQPLKNVASINIEDAKTLRISPWDKNQIKDIERSLHSANLGFSISVDDNGIRVIIPALTTETRNHLAKIAKERLEDARIAIRKARESVLNNLKEQKLSEDNLRDAKEKLQELVNLTNEKLEDYYTRKEKEIFS